MDVLTISLPLTLLRASSFIQYLEIEMLMGYLYRNNYCFVATFGIHLRVL
jgi:hypothetical protein